MSPSIYSYVESRVLRAQGRLAEALAVSEASFDGRGELSITSAVVKRVLFQAVEAALELDDPGKAEELLSASRRAPAR